MTAKISMTSLVAISLQLLMLLSISLQANATRSCSEIFLKSDQSVDFQILIPRYIVSKEIYKSAEVALYETGWRPIEGYGKKEVWEYDGPRGAERFYNPKRDYEEAFAEIITKTDSTLETSFDFFENFLRERKINKQQTNVLDLFGSGFFIEGQNFADSITGMRFGPFDRSQLPSDYKGQVPTEILGDAMNSKTWQKLDESFLTRSIHSIDLVTMRPKGGWQQATFSHTADQNIQALKYIIGQVLLRLSPSGRFYFKIPISQLPGKLSDHAVLQDLVMKIQMETPYRLILVSKLTSYGATYCLEGALVPK